MKKVALLCSVLLISAVCALAQYGSQDTQSSASSNMGSSNSKMTTVQGCLSGSGGNYTLTDKTGTAYNLSGDTSRLQAHVGHTISVTGTTSGSGASGTSQSGSMSSPSDSSSQTLNVTSFRHVSPTCTSSSQ